MQSEVDTVVQLEAFRPKFAVILPLGDHAGERNVSPTSLAVLLPRSVEAFHMLLRESGPIYCFGN